MNKDEMLKNMSGSTNQKDDENIKRLPERYLKEGLTAFNFCMAFIASSEYNDAFSMLVAKEDVFRALKEATDIAVDLLKAKIHELHPNIPAEELDFMFFYECYNSESDDNSLKYAEAAVALREDIREGKYKDEASVILTISKKCMNTLFENGISQIHTVINNHLKNLPTDVVMSWLNEFAILTNECIALNTLVNPKYEYIICDDFPYPKLISIIIDIQRCGKEVNSGTNIFWDLIFETGKTVYTERSKDIDDEVYNTDEKLLRMLMQLTPSVREASIQNNIEPYDAALISDALHEHIQSLLSCYENVPNIVLEYIDTITCNTIMKINTEIINYITMSFRLLDVFDASRVADNSGGLLYSILTCDFNGYDS